MIPVSLTIQGIYSYQAKQNIDFTKLTSAGIFGIFGPVGSGKSTILEAITFALYGRTDRLNLSGDNRNYNMMNLKSNEMLIDFVFRTGAEQTEYMASVRSRRNSKQFDDVKACDRTAYRKTDNNWHPIEIEKLESIIGLSYDNFKRTIIIPQGKFQEFLLLGSKDRTLMMKELFNLDRFELYYKVASIESKTNQQKQNIEGQLQQLGEITKEQIAETEMLLSKILQEIEESVKKLALRQEEERQLKKLKETTDKIEAYKVQLSTLKQQEPELEDLEKKLADLEYCIIHFKTLLNSIGTASTNIGELKKVLISDELSLREITAQIQKLESDFENIRKNYETREVLKQKADELTKIVRILDLEDRYKNFQLRIANGEKTIAEVTGKIELQKQKHEKLSLELKGLKERVPDMARLSKIHDWFTINTLHEKTATGIEAEKAVLEKEVENLLQQKAVLFNSDIFIGIALSESYDQIIALLEEKQQTHQNAIEVLNIEKQHFQVQQKLEEYSSALEDGKPCPLCGSLSHPQKFNSHNIREGLLNIGKELSNHERFLNQIDKSLKKLTEINTALCLKEDSLEKILRKLEENQQQRAEHRTLFVWEDIKDEAALAAMFQQAEKVQTEIAAYEKEIEDLRIQTEKDSNQKEIYTKAIVDIQKNSIKELSEANTLKEQISLLDIGNFAGKNPDMISAESETLLKQYREIETQYQKSLDRLTQLRKEQDTLTGKLDTNRKSLEKEEQTLKSLGTNMDEQLRQSRFSSQEEVKKILTMNLDLEQGRKRIASFRQELDFVMKQLDMLTLQMNEQQFNPTAYQQIQETIQNLADGLNRKNQAKGQQELYLQNIKKDFATRESLLDSLAKIANRLEDIKTLKQLFKGNGFVKYISSVYLQELVHSANERFYKLSGQKLSLELNAENDFEIRDYLNGGKLRNVKTLSGGQTFQAALSLALALSDNTKKLSGADENFFFLDEGFGSLDKESLQIVFETLKSLRHENRIVGIISHVEEMNQEIDIHLKVKNYEETGSVVEKSWERI